MHGFSPLPGTVPVFKGGELQNGGTAREPLKGFRNIKKKEKER
jgi:hypothetical protein